MTTLQFNELVEQGRLECLQPLPFEMDSYEKFLEVSKAWPKPSIYKPHVKVKVSHSYHVTKLRDMGHKYFDMIWRELKLMPRNELYSTMAGWMGIEEPKAHFTFFNPAQCIEAIEFSVQFLNDNRRLDLDFGAPEPTPFYELIIKQ